jgi:hypothetical protein
MRKDFLPVKNDKEFLDNLNEICKHIPDDWSVEINLTNSSGSLYVFNGDGNIIVNVDDYPEYLQDLDYLITYGDK